MARLMDPVEEWRAVIGHEDIYEVSDQGRVHSLITGKYLKPSTQKRGGYLHVVLVRPYRSVLIQYLVAEAFIGPRINGEEVRHLNGIPIDNYVGNLEYGTRSENSEDSKRHGTHFHASATECIRGHDLTDQANLQKTARGGRRICLACRRERQALYNAGKRVKSEGYCINGHPVIPENRYPNGSGRTRCKPCVQEKRLA